MRKAWAVVFVMAGVVLTSMSCTDDDHVTASRQKVQMLVSVPGMAAASSQHRMGDPGGAVPEEADWDRLTVILAYADGSRVLKTTLTRDDFEQLPVYGADAGVRLLTIEAWTGEAYIYGITYSSTAAHSPAADIDACSSNREVQDLTISNDYASGDVLKFVSVATGYYQNGSEQGQPAPFEVQPEGAGMVSAIPTVTLTRLATKIDVQWDAADAADEGYTNIVLTEFRFQGTASGFIFPAIGSHTSALEPQSWTFVNTTPVSQRNGRQYHYTFTDGLTSPSVTFSISGKQHGTEEVEGDYTMQFTSPLQPATWYKVNATVKGITATAHTTISIFN